MFLYKHFLLSSVGLFAVPFAVTLFGLIAGSEAVVRIPVSGRGQEKRLDSYGWDKLFHRSNHGNYLSNITNVVSGQQGKQLTFQSRVIFNKVGKCGSRVVLGIFDELSRRNGFTLYDTGIGNETHIPLKGQVELVNMVSELEAPFIFERHFHYIDFEKFGAIQPIYINIIRDPISRFTSQYYYKRFGDEVIDKVYKGPEEYLNMTINECVLSNNKECSSQKLFYIVPFFCGQDDRCRKPSDWALEKAMANFADRFLFVGFIEELRATLQVLQELLPAMFKGAVQIYDQTAAIDTMKQQTTSRNKIPPTQEVKKIMRQRMREEYEFYAFVRKYFSRIKSQLGISPKKS
ncbi:uronyl 2-sulfotransferase-like [Ptychodera flava]|uniref:uronyl 2-sulfotransferase-like n=1 Tax=Ptychodera flava TaxID=63121 RepID=UPI00396A9B5C